MRRFFFFFFGWMHALGAVGIDFYKLTGEDTKKMPIVLETEDNAGKDLEMHQLEAVNNAGLSQSQDVLITISSFPSTLSDQQSSGYLLYISL